MNIRNCDIYKVKAYVYTSKLLDYNVQFRGQVYKPPRSISQNKPLPCYLEEVPSVSIPIIRYTTDTDKCNSYRGTIIIDSIVSLPLVGYTAKKLDSRIFVNSDKIRIRG